MYLLWEVHCALPCIFKIYILALTRVLDLNNYIWMNCSLFSVSVVVVEVVILLVVVRTDKCSTRLNLIESLYFYS